MENKNLIFKRNNIMLIIIAIVLLYISISSLVSNKHFFQNSPAFAKLNGELQTSQNDKLQSNINVYMESQKDKNILGYENYHCTNRLYGFDDKFAYAWVYCSGFVFKNGELTQGTAFSVPTRLEYQLPDFNIIGSKQPKDGNLYDSSLKQLFPKLFFDGGYFNIETDSLEEEVRKDALSVRESPRADVPANFNLIPESEAISILKTAYPEFKSYPNNNLPPQSIRTEKDANGWYVAFVQEGSGRPILGAKCFFVNNDKSVQLIGNFNPEIEDIDFSIKICK